jgi:type I restriction enzyme R subunit
MTTQSEQKLEDNLIAQLQGMKYERVQIGDEAGLLANLRAQLEKHNDLQLSDKEFDKVLNHLNKGNVYDRAQVLRDKMHLVRDDGKSVYIEFLNQKQWCQNEFQVTNQTTIEGAYKNRYDVTILINGLPLMQIELKRRGLELKEAFNQVNRYRKHSYSSGYGLYMYIQLFVISNGVNTKYYSNTVGYDNDKKASFKFTSYWANVENKRINKLEDFAKVFLDKCQVAKMISRYMVLTENKTVLALRSYQYYAVEAILDRVKTSTKNGYIWHTTGSGKTLTSFKASQILIDIPEIEKVVFVVDRNDLDDQTIREFNAFKADSVDPTDNTRNLVKQFEDPDTKLIVTTIQKLNTAISREHHLSKMDKLRDKKIVFIFDECHRSQFGETHKRITDYFTNRQMFGFTGTPIFADNASGNALGKRTTAQLFDDCLHRYVITDAIADENVLRFSVEYYSGFKLKDGTKDIDMDVEGINMKEAFEAPKRLETITDFIIANHSNKTHSREFTSIFCVSSVDVLTKYYDIFKAKKDAGQHNLKIATIFSYGVNEEDKDADGLLDADINLAETGPLNRHSRDKLDGYIADYNALFGTNYSTKDSNSFYNYYRNIAKRVKRREIDILLVVNMFLTGFDSPTLNTLYVDKNLRYHGLLQAYSRTNRILNEQKSQGNIVVFRNLRKATNEAVKLFSNKNASEIIFMEPYEDYVEKFVEKLRIMKVYIPTVESVDGLANEEAEALFVTHFKDLLKLKNILSTFTNFDFANLGISEQEFVDYQSKYLDLYDKVRSDQAKEKVSILDDIDFELELIKRDKINVSYILRLLAQLVDADDEQKNKLTKNIVDALASDTVLRSKRELIEKFIEQNIPEIDESEEVEDEFEAFWRKEELEAFEKICQEEGLVTTQLQRVINDYLFTGRKPRRDELISALKQKPSVLERDSIFKKLAAKVNNFIETFIEGV